MQHIDSVSGRRKAVPTSIIMRLLLSSVLPTLSVLPATAGPAFDLSDSYSPRTDAVAGYYACRSGLDFETFTWQFDVNADGRYALRGQDGAGSLQVSAENGTIDFDGGPFQSDATAGTYARAATRVSDGTPVIIIRYDFGDTVTDDYCALVE